MLHFVLLFCSFLLYILSSSITVFFSFYSTLIKRNVNFSYVTYIFKWNNKYCFPKIISSSVCLLLLIVPCSLFTRSIPPLNSSPSIDLPWKFSTRRERFRNYPHRSDAERLNFSFPQKRAIFIFRRGRGEWRKSCFRMKWLMLFLFFFFFSNSRKEKESKEVFFFFFWKESIILMRNIYFEEFFIIIIVITRRYRCRLTFLNFFFKFTD